MIKWNQSLRTYNKGAGTDLTPNLSHIISSLDRSTLDSLAHCILYFMLFLGRVVPKDVHPFIMISQNDCYQAGSKATTAESSQIQMQPM